MTMEKQKVIEAFVELPLSNEFVESTTPISPVSVENLRAKSPAMPMILCPEPSDQQKVGTLSREPSVDINYNHLNDQSPSDPDKNDDAKNYDRHRRRSSRLSNLKSDLIESGAIFRPPFTPSNSLAKAPRNWQSPRGSVVEQVSGMRSTSVRPGSRASSGASGSRAPSLPPVPKNPKYANVTSRTVNRTDHQKPVSQVKILHKPLKIEAKSKIGSLENKNHAAGGGQNRIPTQKVVYNVQSKIGSFQNVGHVAGGGKTKVPTQSLNFKEKAKPRIESHMDIKKLQEQQKNGKESNRSANSIHNSATFDK